LKLIFLNTHLSNLEIPNNGHRIFLWVEVCFIIIHTPNWMVLNINWNLLEQKVRRRQNRPTKNRGYDQYAFAIPYGIGVKVALNNNWAINVEASSRITFTDYIDDVSGVYAEPEDINYFVNGVNVGPALADRSTANIGIPGKQRGTSKDKDRFMFVGIGLTYTINTIKCPKVL
jgi:hypothetical protein